MARDLENVEIARTETVEIVLLEVGVETAHMETVRFVEMQDGVNTVRMESVKIVPNSTNLLSSRVIQRRITCPTRIRHCL